MKRSILNQLSELDKKSMGYIAELTYVYGNVCIKADPTSLLDLEVVDDGYSYKIEDMAYVIVHDQEGDDDKIDLIPKNGEEDLSLLSQAVFRIHPEFTQTYEAVKTDEELAAEENVPFEIEEDESRHMLRLTMPVVDEERKKILTDGANLAYDACKAKLDAVNTYYTGTVTALLPGETKEAEDYIKKSLEDTKLNYLGMAEQCKSDKLKEIEDGYQRYLAGVKQAAILADSDSDQWKSLKME